MNIVKWFILKGARKIHRLMSKTPYEWRDESHAQYKDQEANNFIRNRVEHALEYKEGLCISKFGSVELTAVCCCKRNKCGLKIKDYIDYINGKGEIFPEESLKQLTFNAGFFPKDVESEYKFMQRVLEDVKDIDVLASYLDQETYIANELQHCIKVNLDGYYAPFMWEKPWTKMLKGKKVLVVHPFADSIKNQYSRREKLFSDPDVLPEFESLTIIKAVQSLGGNADGTGFADWFEALHYMQREMDASDYDIALIGCGAYGMSLSAHAKRQGKIAIHLAGWTQMLFGIYGNRWLVDQPEYSRFINDYWIRPSESERPKNLDKVENGCYW